MPDDSDESDVNETDGAAAAGDACPYCGRQQPPSLRGGERALPESSRGGPPLWRCGGCNLHLVESWLVADPARIALDDEHAVLCPWCGFPVGLRQEVPRDGVDFACAGCAGTLQSGFLVTAAALGGDRETGRRERLRWLWLLAALALAAWFFGAFVR